MFQQTPRYKLQRTCNLMVQINWCWFYSKIVISGQVQAITQPLLGQLGWKFFGSSGDHQLSISYEKSKLRSLIFHFLIFRAPFGLIANIYNIIVKITGCQAWMLLNCFRRMPGSCNSCEQDGANRDAACFCDAVPRPTKHKLRTSKLIFLTNFTNKNK